MADESRPPESIRLTGTSLTSEVGDRGLESSEELLLRGSSTTAPGCDGSGSQYSETWILPSRTRERGARPGA